MEKLKQKLLNSLESVKAVHRRGRIYGKCGFDSGKWKVKNYHVSSYIITKYRKRILNHTRNLKYNSLLIHIDCADNFKTFTMLKELTTKKHN